MQFLGIFVIPFGFFDNILRFCRPFCIVFLLIINYINLNTNTYQNKTIILLEKLDTAEATQVYTSIMKEKKEYLDTVKLKNKT